MKNETNHPNFRVRKVLVAMLAMLALAMGQTAWAERYVTDVMLIGGTQSKTNQLKSELTSHEWTFVDRNLNDGCGISSDYIYLLYKTEGNNDGLNHGYITDFLIMRSDEADETVAYNGRTYYLVSYDGGNNFTNSQGNLNSGTRGESIHLYYTKDKLSEDRAVTDIYFTGSQNDAVGLPGSPVGFNLNAGTDGSSIYMHLYTHAILTPFSGNGTSSDPYLIGSTDDWVTFTTIIQRGFGDGKYFKLTNNISVTTMAGTSEQPFKGTFDGNGKTLTVDISSSEQGAAPFHYVNAATIKNLTVGGTVTATAYHAAGLVGLCSGNLTVTGCAVATDISATGYAGGIVGHSGSNTINISNSFYRGTISGFKNYAGGLIGWGDAQTLNMNNCLFRGTFTPAEGGLYHPIACTNKASTATATVTDAYYLNTITPTAAANKTIPGAEGTPVSETYVPGKWVSPVEAADGNTYYGPPVVVTVGDGTYRTFQTPYYNNRNYSFSQQLYTAEEIGMSGVITSIAFRFDRAFSLNGVQVYLKHTNKSEFSDWTDVIPISASNLVFDGTFSGEKDIWATITLDTPFEYDGTSNLLVCCVDPTSEVQVPDLYCYWHETSKKTVIFGFSLSEAPDIEDLPHYSSYRNCHNNRDNIQFTFAPISSIVPKPVNLCVNSCTEQDATLTWAAPETEKTITGYVYQYKQADQVNWSNPVTVGANTTSATISGLSTFTSYLFRVKALSNEKESTYDAIQFTTPISLPYECGFENGMKGWNMVNISGRTEIINHYHHDGEHAFRLGQFSTGEHDPQYLISPRFNATVPLMVSFYYFTDTYWEPKFQIGYSTTTDDPSSFTWIEEITVLPLEWKKYEHTFPVGTRFIAIQYNHVDNENSYTMYLDDFSFIEYSPYAKPTDLTVSELTDHGAWLSWTPPTDASFESYVLQYKKVTDADWSAETTWPKNSTAIGLNNLSANTEYDFRVKALYAGGNASNYASTRFMTEGPGVSLPFTESFENGMGSWRIVNGNYNTGIFSNNTDYAHDGSQSFLFFSPDNQDPYQYLMSPQFDGQKSMKVSFYYKNNYPENNTQYHAIFQVGYSTTSKDPSAFTWENLIVSDKDWKEYITFFPAGTKYVAIRWIRGHWLFVDDFSFTEADVPAVPQQLTATNLTGKTADLSWTGNTETYEVRYKKVPLFFDDFEQYVLNPMKWKTVNKGGNTNTWWHVGRVVNNYDEVVAHSGIYVAMAGSYDTETNMGYEVDNWLITPQVTLDGTLKFWVTDDGLHHEHYEVWVSTTTNDISDFTYVAEPGPPSDVLFWTEKSVDLSSFKGQKGYVAIRLNSANQYMLCIDDFGIYQDGGVWKTKNTTDNSVRLTELDPLSDYECQVRATIGNYATDWSNKITFSTNSIATGISEQLERSASSDRWYDLNGRKLSGKPTQKGLYLHNGRKVVVK